ncbi:dihydroneopterin triphosphate diphosphatase [Nitrogeniibacter mangrovi]|uniref:Dihydroneopterin triphosphate diphosphatase n=1 Tax=Nitrogeniibacter mangrovi TaxID=2016596 RepID=A0A6C1B492_9RHOO|nr:dihydroneopterin triphosphate diphosphatase [Nitrogeniibacter mangrovi]QID18516.1 dihydroneopterin triphosphate diphosphatase [Nitrogeniibacter mangrovi]
MSPDKRPVSVLVVVHTRTGHTLLLRRQPPTRFWQSITGSLEPGETPHEAAVRELAEETGLIAASADLHDWQLQNRFPIPPKWAARYAPGVRFNTEHAFSLQLPAPCDVRLAPGEHDAAEWLPLHKAIDRAWSWTNRDLMRLILAQPADPIR